MHTARHYPRAPITEALIDFRTVGISGLDSLQNFGKRVGSAYPNAGVREMLEAELRGTVGRPDHAMSSKKTTQGYIYHSTDRKQAVQARLDGFTFSRFNPYEDWTHLRSEALRLWNTFVEVVQPKTVVRVALRYINKIDLPLGNEPLDFERYLRILPRIADRNDMSVGQFFMRLALPQEDLRATLVLTEALLPPENPSSLGVILDLDLFREQTTFDPASKEIWELLDTFRHRKNDFFEASITDNARRLFE